jgi:hypothetical protein
VKPIPPIIAKFKYYRGAKKYKEKIERGQNPAVLIATRFTHRELTPIAPPRAKHDFTIWRTNFGQTAGNACAADVCSDWLVFLPTPVSIACPSNYLCVRLINNPPLNGTILALPKLASAVCLIRAHSKPVRAPTRPRE